MAMRSDSVLTGQQSFAIYVKPALSTQGLSHHARGEFMASQSLEFHLNHGMEWGLHVGAVPEAGSSHNSE